MKGPPLAALDEAQMLQTPGLVESGASRLKRSVSRWSIFPLTYFVPSGLPLFGRVLNGERSVAGGCGSAIGGIAAISRSASWPLPCLR